MGPSSPDRAVADRARPVVESSYTTFMAGLSQHGEGDLFLRRRGRLVMLLGRFVSSNGALQVPTERAPGPPSS